MAGGLGSRLWPQSRQLYPEQFLPLGDDQLTLLQSSIQRLQGLECHPPIVLCHEQHRFLAAEQIRQLGFEQPDILLEPVSRNSAPAIALAALHAMRQDKDPMLLVLFADHLILDVPALHKCLSSALPLATAGRMMTFGVHQTRLESGYGVIEKGAEIAPGCFAVRQFQETSDLPVAQDYSASGEHYWNSGMYLFLASRYLEELEHFQPDLLSTCRKAFELSTKDLDFTRADHATFAACPAVSIDHVVLDNTEKAAMVPLDAGWIDIGSWSTLWEIGTKDVDGNVAKGDVLLQDSRTTYVQSENSLVAVLGVEDLVIIETRDALLVAHRDKVKDVEAIVERIKNDGRNEHINHRKVYRPWGLYDAIGNGNRYQVKRITVKPGAKLSVQMHHHRAEHWIIVSGTAKVTKGAKTYLLSENQSTFIPIGQVHALENPGVIPLELIEVQSGAYLGEDDIIRLQDVYGRT